LTDRAEKAKKIGGRRRGYLEWTAKVQTCEAGHRNIYKEIHR